MAEVTLHTHFPSGYRDFMLSVGSGYLNDRARVLPPDEIVDKTAEYREILDFLYGDEGDGDPFDLFEAGLDLLPPDRLMRCILLVNAGDGHQIIYHPDVPDKIFLLPHDHDRIYRIGQTLQEALTWFLASERYTHPVQALNAAGEFEKLTGWYFEPDRTPYHIQLALQQAVMYSTVRLQLIEAARQQMDSTLLVRTSYTRDNGEEIEQLSLFVSAFGGRIAVTNDYQVDGSLILTITSDPDQAAADMHPLVEVYRRQARGQLGNQGRIVPLVN